MKPTLAIIKIGGNILDDGRALDAFTELFSSLKTPRILIHGGGKSASELSRKLGIEPNMHEGRRITDAATLDIAVMTYAGLINKNLVAKLQAKTCNAIGISGVDGSLIPATKRISAIEYGFVGDVDYSSINTHLLTLLLNADFIPVIAPITHDKSGQLLNTNADTIASAIASSMAISFDVKLIYCFEKNGVLMNAADDSSVIQEISKSRLKELTDENVISGGMLPKLKNAFDALENGVKTVLIGHASNLIRLIENGNSGTSIRL